MIKTEPDLFPDAHTHQQSNENHLFYRELFRRLEKNHDGRIDVDRLIQLLEKVGLETSSEKRGHTARVSPMNHWSDRTIVLHASELSIKAEACPMLHRSRSKNSSTIFSSKRVNWIWSFERWMRTTWVSEHETCLIFILIVGLISIVGRFDSEDLVDYFNKLGIKLELAEAKKLVEKYIHLISLARRGGMHLILSEWTKTIPWRSPMTNGVRSFWWILWSSRVSPMIQMKCSNIGVGLR